MDDPLRFAREALDGAAEHIRDAEEPQNYTREESALALQMAQARALTAIGVLLGVIAENTQRPVTVTGLGFG